MSKQVENTQKKVKYFDYPLLFIVIALLCFGFIMLYSTSAYTATLKLNDGAYYVKKQIAACLIGWFFAFCIMKVDYKFLKIFAGPAVLVSMILCVTVLFAGVSLNNSSRWLYIGPISIQPSEIAKVSVILYLATVISNKPNYMRDFSNVMKSLAILIPLLGVVTYTNLSTGLIIAGIAFVMIFVANPSYLKFLYLILILAAGAAVFVLMASYRMTRFKIWLHPEDFDEGYQTLQGLYAIGSGGLFGKGLGESTQKLFVPEANNDMIFSIICEEMGLFGAICLLIMYLVLIWRFLYIANHARDLFGSFLVIGIMTHIALQVILNVAVVTNTIPNTGITLPFVSYGGSSMVILMVEMGIALAVSKGMGFEA